ncbi:hypothetical protein LUZ61_011626 [Rhynchospora tenuis]|uniref:Exopolygalacturonase n=1 Tax=Rhynchospora tenuis TaxID=198213 RepID=A0AAD6F0F4_9POAL|nr:hypothetical protein LUZ61_011626 [Rhynchospora tenuis]
MVFLTILKCPILLFVVAYTINAQNLSTGYYNVIDYGAVADGQTDSTQAFLKAWVEACMGDGAPTILIPKGAYLVGPLTFKGPCKSPVSVRLKGSLLASTDLGLFSNNWIEFQYIKGLKITGGGTLDGQGASAWPNNKCHRNSKCNILPVSLVLSFVEDAIINAIHLVNSKFFHMNIFASKNVHLNKLKIKAPTDSPNTDGIHMGDVTNIKISNTIIGTGDDCISIGPGSVNVAISNVKCGPGHGISIGSLGKYLNEKDVRGLRVQNCTLTGTTNGVRIKTWENNPSSLVASDIFFEDIQMDDVDNPIVIDQKYCPHNFCSDRDSPSKVKVQNVVFRNIKGTSTSPVAVQLVCSDAVPCEGIELSSVFLQSDKYELKTVCANVHGSYHLNPTRSASREASVGAPIARADASIHEN